VRLAGDSSNDAIHEAAEASAWEGSHIAPHSRWSQKTVLHRLDQTSDGESFPLHEHDRASNWDCQLDAEIEPGAASAETDEAQIVCGT
jgi:hypothetical protein